MNVSRRVLGIIAIGFIVLLLAVAIWLLFFKEEASAPTPNKTETGTSQKNQKNDDTSKQQARDKSRSSQNGSSSGSSSSSRPNNSSAQNNSAPSSQSNQQGLASTGPKENLAVFLGGSLMGAILYQKYLRHRLRSSQS
jgi:cytoskeletal protein RodZ